MKRRWFWLWLAVFSVAVSAQSVRGRIEGVVRDQQGQVVPNATIKAANTGTGAAFQAVTSSEGSFVIPEVQPGLYRVTAEAAGFKKFTVEGIVVQVATVSTVTIDLQTGQLAEEITVNASAAQEVVNTSTPEVGDVIDRQRILELPLDGRNPLELATLQAGVQTTVGSDGETTRFSINGNRVVANNVTIDGVNASDSFLKMAANIALPLIPVSVESIGEFRVTTALPSAEFGRGSAQINAITASGTNNMRGSIFWFHRNTAFNANTFFNNATVNPDTGRTLEREPLIRNQFGGRLGGPIRRDRTHFFSSYEGKREVRGLSRNRTVYTAQARQGTYQFLGNFIYQLPVGRGRRFLGKLRGTPQQFLGGWQAGGIVRWTSGDPLDITSGRGTFNRDDRSAANTVDVRGNPGRGALQELTGIRSTQAGIFYLDPNLAPGSSSDESKLLFDNPRAGAVGSLGLSPIFGPGYFNFDFSLLKSANFGRITTTNGRPRLMQFALRLNF